MAADGSDPRPLGRSPETTDSVWDGSWGADGRIAFMRTPQPAATAQPIAREDLGVASMLIAIGVLSLVFVLLTRTAPPFGAFAVALGAATALIAIQGDGWRFVPGAIAAGLAADLCTRFASRERAPVAAAAASAGLVVAAGLVAIASGGLGWTATLWLGVAVAAGVAGWVIAWIASTAGASGAPSVPATSTPVDDST